MRISPYSPIYSLLHFLHGLASGIAWHIDYRVSLFMFFLFFLYEFVEYVKVKDTMYFELREWIAGFTLGWVLLGVSWEREGG